MVSDAVLASGVQQRESVTHIHAGGPVLPWRLLQDMEETPPGPHGRSSLVIPSACSGVCASVFLLVNPFHTCLLSGAEDPFGGWTPMPKSAHLRRAPVAHHFGALGDTEMTVLPIQSLGSKAGRAASQNADLRPCPSAAAPTEAPRCLASQDHLPFAETFISSPEPRTSLLNFLSQFMSLGSQKSVLILEPPG